MNNQTMNNHQLNEVYYECQPMIASDHTLAKVTMMTKISLGLIWLIDASQRSPEKDIPDSGVLDCYDVFAAAFDVLNDEVKEVTIKALEDLVIALKQREQE